MMNKTAAVTAKDIMIADLLTAYEGWTIHHLAEFFITRKISAAPVIASDHELVGVVSISDVFRFNNMTDSARGDALRNHYRDTCGQEVNEEDLRTWVKNADRNCTVHQIMTPEVIAIDKSAGINEIIKVLVDSHIHRVFVTDMNKIVGVVTAMDILSVVHERMNNDSK